ncbi:hypothetical protein ACHAPU_010186 [Fusarium lateritium]
MLEYLLHEKQADANPLQPDGSTPLMLALRYNKTNPQRHLVAYTLLENGADIMLQNKKKETAKHIAKTTQVDGDKAVLKLLDVHAELVKIRRQSEQILNV